MERSVKIFLLILMPALLILQCAGRESWAKTPQIPAPKWMRVTLVGDRMIINGMSSTVQYFEADVPRKEVLQYYRQQWLVDEGGKKRGYRETEAGQYVVIARLEDERYLLTVQAQKDGGFQTSGYLAVGDLKSVEGKKTTYDDVPKLSGSKVVNDYVSYDPGKKGRTLLIANSQPLQNNIEYYRTHYAGSGWVKEVDLDQGQGQLLIFHKFGNEAHLVLTENFSGTQIVINLIEDL